MRSATDESCGSFLWTFHLRSRDCGSNHGAWHRPRCSRAEHSNLLRATNYLCDLAGDLLYGARCRTPGDLVCE